MAFLLDSNIKGSINVVQNTSTGNLFVTQNTITGNIVISTLTNTSTLNVSTTANIATLNSLGVVTANASPLTNLATQPITTIGGVTTISYGFTTTVLSGIGALLLNLHETGWYDFEMLLIFAANNASANGFSGLQFDIASNTAITANQKSYYEGFSNVYISLQAGKNLFVTGNADTSQTNCSTSATTPSWYISRGSFTLTTPGSVGVRVACAQATLNNLYLLEGSYFTSSKIASL